MSDAPIQTVRVHLVSIRSAHVPPTDLNIDPATMLHELLALLVRQGHVPPDADWAFRADDVVFQLTDTIRAVLDRCGPAATPNGVLQLFLFDRATLTPLPPASGSHAPGSFSLPQPAGRAAPPPPAPPAAAPSAARDADDKAAPQARREIPRGERPANAASKRKSSERRRLNETADGVALQGRSTTRRATVRYYSRMNPDRMFPLLVILSKEEVAEIVKAKVKQAQSEAFQVEEGSVVEVEPVLPGCDCYPPRHALTVDADGTTSATIWVVPRVLGRVQGARVLIRQGTTVLAEVPLDVRVAKQTLAVACGLLSLAAPYMTMGLKSLKLDYESQKADGFPLYQRAGSWVAENLRPEWLGLGFLALAFLLYLWMRPRRRDVFWDVNPK